MEGNQQNEIDKDLPLSVLRQRVESDTMQLKPVNKQSESDVWKYFAHLFQNKKIVKRFQNRILCKVCYENNRHIKRIVFILLFTCFQVLNFEPCLYACRFHYSYSKTISPTNLREQLSHEHKIELAVTKTIEKKINKH